MSANLKAVFDHLKSDKIKDRQEGIASLRAAFTRDHAIRNLDEKRDGRAWLIVFQALFTSVIKEKEVCTKKAATGKTATTGATALRRLSEAAATVRWLTERSVRELNKKTLKPLLAHCLQTMIHRGELYAPVALDYIKTIKCLLSWTPHMDHLDETNWLKIIEMAFNVILEDPVRRPLEDDSEAGSESIQVEDSDMYQDDTDGQEGADNIPSTSTQTLKRRRREMGSTPAPTSGSTSTPLKQTLHSIVSLEQIEFTSLLAILLRSPCAPLLSDTVPNLSSAILARMRRFLQLYPTDTSLHHDFLLALQATLSHVALNRKNDVQTFAREAWEGLVKLWGTKNKRMKESLVGVLRALFPFLTIDHDGTSYAWAEGVHRLWHLLNGEAESRWGIDGLSLDSLRLEVISPEDEDICEREPFVARTFRAGWHFDPNQALAWAVLDLQADCAMKLFEHSESVHTGTPEFESNRGKRVKREDPITFLLQSVQHTLAPAIRACHLQVLLFFIDRYWHRLHDSLQQDVINTLLQFISIDDATTQSWTFLCFAAIARSDCATIPSTLTPAPGNSIPDSTTRSPTIWDPIWTHAMRRANVPVVCRAACHTAYTLISHAKHLLTAQRILIEIETLAKDLDLQGPTFPYDSVCMFLSHCLREASRNVRLYRMQLEEKVLSWLLDNWRVGPVQSIKDPSGISRMPLHTVADILNLLEHICGTSKRSDLICQVLLPECSIVDVMVEERKTRVIRDFLLFARLSPFHKVSEFSTVHADSERQPSAVTDYDEKLGQELLQPQGRERRVSAALLKSLEGLLSVWEAMKESNAHPTAEKARQALDIAITALAFESLLVWNGTRSNRRVLQCASKLITLVTPLMTASKWTMEERALILHALEPLITNGEEKSDDEWHAMLPPDIGSGIKTQTLRSIKLDVEKRNHSHLLRRQFQKVFWGNTDIQDVFGVVSGAIRDVLRIITNQSSHDSTTGHTIDDKDGFGPIRTTRAALQTPEENQKQEHSRAVSYLTRLCMSFLAVAPILQSSSGESTRDKELNELVLECPDDKFLLVGPAYLNQVHQRVFNVTIKVLDEILDKLGDLLRDYTYSQSAQLQLLAAKVLSSTSHVWLQKPCTESEVGDNVRALCRWMSQIIGGKKVRAWKVRDAIARFFDWYLSQDPSQSFWPTASHEDDDDDELVMSPATILPTLGADDDIRVRFRVAVTNARLFAIARATEREALGLYDEIKNSLTRVLTNYEQMLTRMLSLGNIMVVSSAVRRGPYWHLLEAAFHSPVYSNHIEAILNGVSQRLGLTSPSQLFEAYASQIAYSIRQSLQDVLRLAPRLLGYKDRKQCAKATFRSFTPTNVMAGGPDTRAITHGKNLFVGHCAAIQKSPREGIRDCIGDLVGFQIVCWLDGKLGDSAVSVRGLEEQLITNNILEDEQGALDICIENHADGIVAAIVRTLGDQDFSPEGAIVEGLRSIGGSGDEVNIFHQLAKYRRLLDFELHNPNLPAFSTNTVLRAIQWCSSKIPPDRERATSYHVLHQLFADVQDTPLVNEQIRLLNGITLLISIRHRDFLDPTLLHTLIHGTIPFLGQSDLAQTARSFLEWAFGRYRSTTQIDPRFPDILLQICTLAHDYTADVATTELGNCLLDWMDDQALQLCHSVKIKSQVVKALSAWPHQPSSELLSVYEDITSTKLSAMLSDSRITSNKFRLVRRLRDLTEQHAYDRTQFAVADFWRLKECIPPREQLQYGDIEAFASLLVANAGDIYSFGSEQPSTRTIRAAHRRPVQAEASADPSPQRAIVESLLAMLDGNVPSQANLAYRTLRLLMAAIPSDTLMYQSWPFEYRTPLEYLRTFPTVIRTRPERNITELQISESSLEKDFTKWISMVTVLLADILSASDPFFAQFSTILHFDPVFAEDILPVLVHAVLQSERAQKTSVDRPIRKHLSAYFSAILQLDHVHMSCLRCIVDVILHLRNFKPSKTPDLLSYDKWLAIDYRILARSAVTCGAYTTALLFLELAIEYRGHNSDATEAAEHILFDIYSHIDEPDGFYGITTSDLRQFLIKRFHHEKQWEKAFQFHGAALEAGKPDTIDTEGLLRSFHAFGFDRLAINSLQSPHIGYDSKTTSSGLSYHLGWRTETWDLPDSREVSSSGVSLYQALRAIYRERDPKIIDRVVRDGLYDEMARLRSLGTENITEIREVARNVMCLNQITHWRSDRAQQRLENKIVDLSKWPDILQINSDFDFTDLESVIATRVSLFRSVIQKEEREQIGTMLSPFIRGLVNLEKNVLVRLSQAARKSDQLQIALNSIVKAQRLESDPSPEVSQEFANVLWRQKEQKLAIQFLKDVMHRDTKAQQAADSDIQRALTLARLGAWISEACLEKPTDIMRQFFDPATTLAAQLEKRTKSFGTACASVYHKCALFAEQQYQSILKSPDAVRWKIYVERKTDEIKRRESQLMKTQTNATDYSTLRSDQNKARTQLDQDIRLFRQHNGARDSFLEQALDMYSRCLASCDSFDDDGPIRLCSLWFANFDDERVQEKIHPMLLRVPSRKFVFLSHQLTARISKPSSGTLPKNQTSLQALVVRMCQEHPFHSLYQVYCLLSESKPSSSRRTSTRLESPSSQIDRTDAALGIFDRLRNDLCGQKLAAVERVCDASLEWAKYPIKEKLKKHNSEAKRANSFNIPENLLLRQIRDVQVPVLTVHTPLDPTLKYNNCIWISNFETTFKTAGGINVPKINNCIGSDGGKYVQLFKGEGNDDMRQDAVMEQVFNLVNVVLRCDRETRKRDLKIRDYTVLPLAAQAGVLEFVGNTIPLHSWLTKAHPEYRPQDPKHEALMHQLRLVRQTDGKTESLVAKFKEILATTGPVMRHYFSHKHKTPIAWFAARLNYTRSVATTSIVGHILGLGDRHVSNILLDESSGEVVHIDLGIAFDQGKLLPIPERVPFRMTRDMVDGMGSSGTQGVFQRCAEETLRILRDRSDVILTVLEVFKYDPLHSWTASELKLKRVQGMESERTTTMRMARDAPRPGGITIDMASGTADEAADRALASVARKLDKALSVEYTVNELIAEATDPVNLATIFAGWSPDF